MGKIVREDQVHVRISGALRARLEDEAVQSGRSLSNLIRTILIEHVAQRDAGAATTKREAA